MEPIALGEPKEDAECLANDPSELTHGFRLADIQPVHRIDQAVFQHEQCRPMKMGNEEQQKVFMPELLEVRFAIDEYAGTAVTYHGECAAIAHEPGPWPFSILPIPVAVVTITPFEIFQMALGIGQRIRSTGRGS